MVPGTTFGDLENTCYIPVFASNRTDGVWYVGNMILNYLYLTFDMTPYDEHSKDYIQIGVAPKNTENKIGQFYDNTEDTTGDISKPDVDPIPVPVPDPQPTPDPDNTNTTTDTNTTDDKPVPDIKPKPDDEEHRVIVGPTEDEQPIGSWMSKNGTWVAIASIILVVLLFTCVYSCWRKRQNPYFAKHYSVLSEGPVNLFSRFGHKN